MTFNVRQCLCSRRVGRCKLESFDIFWILFSCLLVRTAFKLSFTQLSLLGSVLVFFLQVLLLQQMQSVTLLSESLVKTVLSVFQHRDLLIFPLNEVLKFKFLVSERVFWVRGVFPLLIKSSSYCICLFFDTLTLDLHLLKLLCLRRDLTRQHFKVIDRVLYNLFQDDLCFAYFTNFNFVSEIIFSDTRVVLDQDTPRVWPLKDDLLTRLAAGWGTQGT